MKILGFLKQNIIGFICSILLAVGVWYFTGYNIVLLIAGFIAGYVVIGILAEFLISITTIYKEVKDPLMPREGADTGGSSKEIVYLNEEDLK